MLSRESHGPRAVLNALDRLEGTYEAQAENARQDLAIAEGQHRDHQARIGRPFGHDAYLDELTGLRDQLKAGLSQATPEPGTTTVAELAERIKALKAAHSIDAAPERTAPRRIAAEEPVTARIHRRLIAEPALEPAAEVVEPVEEIAPPVEAEPVLAEESNPPVVIPFVPEAKPPAAGRPQTGYREQVGRTGKRDARQLSLF
jgi:hypothetical protein